MGGRENHCGRRGGSIALCATALLTLLAGPAHGAVSLGPVEAISAAGSYAPEISVSTSGRLLATWGSGRNGHAIARFGKVGSRRWSAARVVVPTSALHTQAIGSDGTAALAWIVGEVSSPLVAKVMLSIAPPGRPFGPGRLVASVKRLGGPVLGVRPDGTVVVAWSSATGPSDDAQEVSYALARADGAPLASHLLGVAVGSSSPTLAVDGSGAALIACGAIKLSGSGNGQETMAATMPSDSSTFGASLDTLETETFEATAVTAGGRAFLLTRAYDSSVPGHPRLFVRTQVLHADGSLDPGHLVHDREVTGGAYSEIEEHPEGTTIASDGALVRTGVETKYAPGLPRRFLGQTIVGDVTTPDASETGAAQAIFDSRGGTHPAGTVAVAFGDVVVTSWDQSPPRSYRGRRIYYAELPSGGTTFSTRRPLSDRFLTSSNVEMTLAAAGRHALAAWIEHGHIYIRELSD